jgi:hypothetical protein
MLKLACGYRDTRLQKAYQLVSVAALVSVCVLQLNALMQANC